MTISKHKKKQPRRGSSVLQNQKTSTYSGGPSAALINTWRRGDDNLEPSAKMLALVRYLKEWETTGDKTIVYSQCTYSWLVTPFSRKLTLFYGDRDIDVGSRRDPVLEARDSKSSL